MNRFAAAALIALAACASAPPTPSSVASDVCTADAARLCPGVQPVGGRVLTCLRGRSAELTPACKLAVEPTGQVQGELNQAAAQDYAQQFVADMKRELKVKRNESAIQGFRARMLSSGN